MNYSKVGIKEFVPKSESFADLEMLETLELNSLDNVQVLPADMLRPLGNLETL